MRKQLLSLAAVASLALPMAAFALSTNINSSLTADISAGSSSSSSMSMSSMSSSSTSSKKGTDAACMQKAVDARETAIIAAWTKYNTSVMAAHTARQSSLHDAWGKTDAKQRRIAVKASWDAYAKARKAANKQWNDERKAAWKTFNTSAKSCKGMNAELSIEAGVQVLEQ